MYVCTHLCKCMRTSVHVYARVRSERTIRIVRVTYYETLTSTLNFEAISSFGSVNKPPSYQRFWQFTCFFYFSLFFSVTALSFRVRYTDARGNVAAFRVSASARKYCKRHRTDFRPSTFSFDRISSSRSRIIK